MSLTVAHLDGLLASGCSAEQIVALVKIDIQEREREAAERRVKDAERQRRHRASRDVTVTDGDSVTCPALSPAPKENNSNPHPHTHPEGDTPPARKAEPVDAHVEAWREWREKNPFPRPWWADRQVWADWMKVRSRKGGVNTITAHNGFLADVAKHADAEWPPGRLLSLAVSKSWLSINRPHGSPRNDRPSPASHHEIQNPYARVAARRQADRAAAIGR